MRVGNYSTLLEGENMNTLTKNIVLFPFNLLYKVSPQLELRLMFRIKQGYSLDLQNPKTYNEKIQWIKLYDKNELMPRCCDKYMVRSYVESMGCGDILNTLYWQGDDPDKIPYDDLPSQFVIKVTHGSTFNIIVRNKENLNKKQVSRTLKKWLHAKFIICYGEWFYGKEKPRIIVEQLLNSDDGEDLKDYKVFCFNGKPAYIRVDSGRFTDHRSDMYDCEWNHLKDHTGYKNSGEVIEKPECLEDMLEYAKKLCKSFLHARIDFYIVKNEIYFGEITFTNGAGFDKFSSYDFDKEMGDCLELPISNRVEGIACL